MASIKHLVNYVVELLVSIVSLWYYPVLSWLSDVLGAEHLWTAIM